MLYTLQLYNLPLTTMLYIASDHGGFRLKEQLKKFLQRNDIGFVDLGPKKFKKDDDYPDYAARVAGRVSAKPNIDQGILLCRSGQGVCIVANKFKGVRAGLVWNIEEAKASRNDDMTNVLCLPSDYISAKAVEKIATVWLATPFSKDKRHVRRVGKIARLERN